MSNKKKKVPHEKTEVDLVKIGRDMKHKQIDLGLSITELEVKTGISSVTISNLFKGQLENPTVNTLQKIAKVLKMKFTLQIE